MTTALVASKEAAHFEFPPARPATSQCRPPAARAQERLLTSSYPDLRSLTCEQVDGALVLRGRVSSYYSKQLAQEILRTLAGSSTILNAVEVVSPDWPPP